MQASSPLESTANRIVRRIQDAGYQAVYAGGCVRDMLRGVVPHDYDIATSARPEEIQSLFRRTHAVGAAFGVINVLENNADFQVATFRCDGVYEDGRRPESVEFSNAEEDAKRVAAARRAVGDDFMLCVDANRGWTAQEAIRFARLIEPLNIAWFEEPCLWYDDAAMMARVRQSTLIPITAGQSEINCQAVRRLVDAGAVDYVNYDVSEGGGVTDWRRVAALCATAGLQMAHHEEAQIASHLLAAVPHGTYAECFAHPDRDPIWQQMWVNRPKVKNGHIQVNPGPGFDIELDEKMIKKYRIN